MTINQTTTGFRSISHERALLEQEIDAYRATAKLPEPSTCPQCGAVFHKGRWQWGAAESDAHSSICPACHRINDNVPAGYVTLEGEFLKDHHEDIIHLIRNHEQHQRTEHHGKPLFHDCASSIAFLSTPINPHRLPRICFSPFHQ